MHWEWGSYLIWHMYRKQVILVPSLFSPWTCSNLLGRAHVYSEDFNRWFWDLIRHSEQRGEWVCLSLATCGSINIVSKNVENGSLNGEAERCSLVLGYCTNHRATPVSGEKATTQDSALFLEERGECRFRKAEVAGCPSEGRHFSAVLTTAVWPGEWWDLLFSSVSFYVMAPQGIFFFFVWALGFHLRHWESPSAAVLSIVTSQTGICFLFLFVSVLHLIKALSSFQWGAVKNQDCQMPRSYSAPGVVLCL